MTRPVLIRPNMHAFVFAPNPGHNGRESCLGISVRFRGVRSGIDVWRHFRIRLAWTPPSRRLGGRGAYKLEADSWRTSPQTNRRRVGYKAFVRFKVGLGGDKDII